MTLFGVVYYPVPDLKNELLAPKPANFSMIKYSYYFDSKGKRKK